MSKTQAKKLRKARIAQANDAATGQTQFAQNTKLGSQNYARRMETEASRVADRNAEMDRRSGGRVVIVTPKPS